MTKILVVEDNEMNRDMVKRRLEKRSFEIVCAVDGQEGVDTAASAQPDLILMDMSLPVIDGWEATRRIKNSPATQHIPVIALTAHAMEGDRQRAYAAGCDDYDTKPVDFTRLMAKIEGQLNKGKPAQAPPEDPSVGAGPIGDFLGYCETLVAGQKECVANLERLHAAGKALVEQMALLQGAPAAVAAPVAPQPKPTAMPLEKNVAAHEALSPLPATAQASPLKGVVLVVDDNETNRDILKRRLENDGHTVAEAADGQQALQMLREYRFDLVLLDIMMPVVDGYQVLEAVKKHTELRHIPVIMISAHNELESVVRCIQMGAEDYLFKPFDPILLRARIGACLEKKRLSDQEHAYLRQIEEERQKSEKLLLNILPQPIAQRLKQDSETIADVFQDVTVLFADIVDFTRLSTSMPTRLMVELLNDIFTTFDQLAAEFHLEKIKTIGDAYMVVGGLPIPRADHVEMAARMALGMVKVISNFKTPKGEPFQVRIGINTGPVIAGVIGKHKFIYDLWGDTVNIASRMESHGLPGRIQVTQMTYACLLDKFEFEPRGAIAVKGKGELSTYFLEGEREGLA